MTGTTTLEFVYDGGGKRLVQSVMVGNTTTRTLYIGNLYEEELTGRANPPYIVYYSFSGKPIAIRRVNQPSQNGQLRVAADHLGSLMG